MADNDSPNRRRKASMGNFRTRYLKFDRNAYSTPTGMGREIEVDIFVPDSGANDPSTVTGMCLTLIKSAPTKYHATALYAYAIGAFAPEVMSAIITHLQKKNAKINTMNDPSQATDMGYAIERLSDIYTYKEALVSLGISLILPFKQLSDYNYQQLINTWKKALGGKLGLMDDEIARHKYPLDLTKAKMVQSGLYTSNKSKQEMIKYVMRASEDSGSLKYMAQYVGDILSWNEMSVLVLIKKVLVDSKSPVMNHPMIQYEVKKFSKAMVLVFRSPYPSYFRYFCTGEELLMIQSKNFSILGAVARELLRSKSTNKSIDNFAGTSEKGSDLVDALVTLHKTYCKESAISGGSKRSRFIFEGDYDELMNTEEDA